MRRILLACAALVATAGPALAGTLSTGALQVTGSDQFRCTLANTGTLAMNFTACVVNSSNGIEHTCESDVLAGGTAKVVLGPSSGRYFCRFEINHKSVARGTASIGSVSGTVAVAIDAR